MTLLGYLSYQAITPMVKKGLFSGRYIFLFEYLSSLTVLYETCSVLGYTYRDNLPIFLQLISEEGRQDDLLKFIGKPSGERLAALKENPKNFYDLLFSEGPELMADLRKAGIIKYSNWEDFSKVSKSKLRIEYAMSKMQMLAAEAIGFGLTYPEMTETLLSYEYDTEEWNKRFKVGLDIGSEPPKKIPLSTRQVEAKAVITPFVESVRPELLSALALQKSQ